MGLVGLASQLARLAPIQLARATVRWPDLGPGDSDEQQVEPFETGHLEPRLREDAEAWGLLLRLPQTRSLVPGLRPAAAPAPGQAVREYVERPPAASEQRDAGRRIGVEAR